MDGWTQKLNQLLAAWRGYSSARRLLVAGVLLIILGSGVWLSVQSSRSRFELLLGGKTFTTDELSRTLAAFQTAGLSQHRVEGQRILVPVAEADRYTAAAVAQKALPTQFAAEFDRMQSRVNLFTSSEQRRELLEEARKTRLAQILRAIPEIEDAVVEWDRAKSTSLFRPQTQLAAHVSVRPRDGRELSPALVQSLKQFIAGALAGATPEDVTVVDMNTSRVHGRRSSAEVASDRVQALTRQTADEINQQISQALRYIPDVLISVNVELLPAVDDLETEIIDPVDVVPIGRHQSRSAAHPDTFLASRSNRPAESRGDFASRIKRPVRQATRQIPARLVEYETSHGEGISGFHKSVQVAISIPDDFYLGVARRRGVAPGGSLVADSAFRAELASIKGETQQDIREKLIRLLPSGTSAKAISVSSYARPPVAPEVEARPPTQFRMHGWSEQQIIVPGAIASGVLLVLIWGATWRMRRRMARQRSVINANESLPAPAPHPESVTSSPEQEAVSPPRNSREGGSEPRGDSLNPYSAILSELAERERDAVIGAPVQSGVFEFLCELTPADTADFLRNEHPQTIALIATGLPSGRAAEVLHALPEALRWDVTQRISRLEPPAAEVCREVAHNLRSRLQERQRLAAETQAGTRARPERRPPFGGPRPFSVRSSLVTTELSGMSAPRAVPATAPASSPGQVISDPATELEKSSPGSNSGAMDAGLMDARPMDAASMDAGPVKFEDLCVLDRMAFAAVLRSVDAKTFALALFDQTEPFQRKFLSQVPRSLAAMILEQTRALGPLRLSDVSAAQNAVASVVWNLSRRGAISLPPHLTGRRSARS